ncbi:hypothetical protein EG329_007672 [Mollisiaceae sp. DMI_Dod_QoI]|nr:hypothetical protein EG329_007672 [Helotiales sp. DMI_Dod_QoI]
MHLILTGATGLVGGAVLHQMLTTPSISKISILSRRPVPQAEGHAKAKVYIHKDFSVYEKSLLDELKDAHGVVWALGISATQVDKPYFPLPIPLPPKTITKMGLIFNVVGLFREYEKITLTYPLAFARSISTTTSPRPVPFIYISGEGATTTPSLLTPHWASIKGRAESSLLALSKSSEFANLRPISVRPGGVDPAKHEEIHGFLPEKGLFRKVLEGVLVPVLRGVVPGMMSPTRELGGVVVGLAVGEGGAFEDGEEGVSGEGRTLSNVKLRKLAGLGK